jgi:hypothetical protein
MVPGCVRRPWPIPPLRRSQVSSDDLAAVFAAVGVTLSGDEVADVVMTLDKDMSGVIEEVCAGGARECLLAQRALCVVCVLLLLVGRAGRVVVRDARRRRWRRRTGRRR